MSDQITEAPVAGEDEVNACPLAFAQGQRQRPAWCQRPAAALPADVA